MTLHLAFRTIPTEIRRAGLKYHNPSRPDESPSKPKKVLNQVMHPIQSIKSHKRKSPDAHAGPSKRKRTGQETGDDDVIVITDDDDDEGERGGGERTVPVTSDEYISVILSDFP